jgi:hypothetical protein
VGFSINDDNSGAEKDNLDSILSNEGIMIKKNRITQLMVTPQHKKIQFKNPFN